MFEDIRDLGNVQKLFWVIEEHNVRDIGPAGRWNAC